MPAISAPLIRTKRLGNATALFLLLALCSCLSCHNGGQSAPRVSDTGVSAPQAEPLFREVAEETGLHFQHYAGATKQMYFPELMGSGVALLDYNNDGALDIFLVQGGLVNAHSKPSDVLFPFPPGQKPGCRLFRNDLLRNGKFHFTDVTEQAGLGHLRLGAGMGVAVGDYDNDGFPDLYVTGYGHSVLLHNEGNGTFTDVTSHAGIGDEGNWATSAAFVDYDRDGKLDLVVANYVNFTVATNQKCYAITGPPDYCGPISYKGVSARLYHNLGGSRFADVTKISGIGSARGAGLGVACADLDEDGWPDIFIANDQTPNALWLNQRNGTFRDAATLTGCATGPTGYPQANMGLAIGDVENKGHDDVLITHLATEGAMLFRNDGSANFHDASAEARLRDATLPYTGFGADWFDYDNDGLLDLFIANGAVATEEKQRGTPWPFQQSNQLFHNEGTGKGFIETTSLAGTSFQQYSVGRGAAFGDLDNDGRIDVVVTNNNGPARLLLNQSTSRNHWMQARLQGVKSNRMGLGAKVALVRKGQALIWRRCHTDGSYLSASDARVYFGLGNDSNAQTLTVQWPSNRRETWNNLPADRCSTLREGMGQP